MCLQMRVVLRRNSKTLPAGLANKRFLSGVSSYVLFQIPFLWKWFFTKWALERLDTCSKNIFDGYIHFIWKKTKKKLATYLRAIADAFSNCSCVKIAYCISHTRTVSRWCEFFDASRDSVLSWSWNCIPENFVYQYLLKKITFIRKIFKKKTIIEIFV